MATTEGFLSLIHYIIAFLYIFSYVNLSTLCRFFSQIPYHFFTISFWHISQTKVPEVTWLWKIFLKTDYIHLFISIVGKRFLSLTFWFAALAVKQYCIFIKSEQLDWKWMCTSLLIKETQLPQAVVPSLHSVSAPHGYYSKTPAPYVCP